MGRRARKLNKLKCFSMTKMHKENEMDIYSLIPRDRYITRRELERITGLNDRSIRNEINRLRKDPSTVIISSSHGKGYKKPSNVEELEMVLNESISRSNDEHEKQRVFRMAITLMKREPSGQMLLDF